MREWDKLTSKTPEQIRKNIADIARSFEGSLKWNYLNTVRGPGNFGLNKCNLFVYDVLYIAGIVSPEIKIEGGRRHPHALVEPRART